MLTGHPMLCKEQLRLSFPICISLGMLKDSRGVRIEEQLGLSLYILAKAASNRDVAERFQHSGETISKYFNKVLDALVKLSSHIIRPYQSLSETPREIQNNATLWPFFKDCVGAIADTLIQST